MHLEPIMNENLITYSFLIIRMQTNGCVETGETAKMNSVKEKAARQGCAK